MVKPGSGAAARNVRAAPEKSRHLAAVKGGDVRTPDKSDSAPVGVVSSELDRLIHERTRLGIVSALAVNESLSFRELRELMHTTDGNLSVHARKLEDARYVSCSKTFEGRVPHTVYQLTATGRRALERYLDHMESIIRATRER